jgi:probable rRNA maturation factor
VSNRQRQKRVDLRHLRRILRHLLAELLERETFELGLYLVGETAIARANYNYLGHKGTTDVITLDYCEPERPEWLAGDIFVCVPIAVNQARTFKTNWQHEVVRYIVHGLLHLLGYNDHTAEDRKKMRRQETRLLQKLAVAFNLNRLARSGHP